MARSTHSVLTAADRFERRISRRPKPTARRTNTRHAVVAAALAEEA